MATERAAAAGVWANRIVGAGQEAPDQLLANPRNARLHPRAQQDALAGVLREVGWVQDIIVNRGTGFVVDGHLRVLLALRADQPYVPVKYVDLSDDEELQILATFDPLGALAAYDRDQLARNVADLRTADPAVVAMLTDLARRNAPGSLPFAVDVGDGADPPLGEDVPPPDGPNDDVLEGAPPSHVRMVQLFLDTGTHPAFVGWVADLMARYGTANLTDTVYRAVQLAHDTPA